MPKKKVIPLNATPLRFPQGDPRNEMSDEEIAAFAAQEEAELDRMIKMSPLLVKTPSGVEEEEDDDVEDFSIDLTNGVVTQSVADGIITANGNILVNGKVIVSSDSDGNIQYVAAEKPEDEFTKLITDELVYRGLRYAKRRIDQDYDELEKVRFTTHTRSIWDTLSKELESLYDRGTDLRKAMPPEGLGGSSIRYENIPDWAKGDVKHYVRGAIRQLLALVDESEL